MQTEILEEEQEHRESREKARSQPEFVPTPFQESVWEVVGERIEDRGFLPLEFDLLPSELTKPDPMFYDFGNTVRVTEGKVAHAGQRAEVKSDESVIDEAMMEKIRSEAFEEGRQAGIIEGREAAIQEANEKHQLLSKELAEFQQNVSSELLKLAARVEKNAFELALSVARKILLTTADIRADYILDVIRHALNSTSAGDPLRIRVSPQDYEFLQVIGLPPDLSSEETGIQYVADDTVTSGCVVETDFGEIDLRLDHMWQQVRENLYEVVKQ